MRSAVRDPEGAQEELLRAILAVNRDTEYFWEGTRQGGFAGLGNFQDLFTRYPLSEQVWRALEHNTLFFVGTMLIQNSLGLFFAVLLYRRKLTKRVFQTLSASTCSASAAMAAPPSPPSPL